MTLPLQTDQRSKGLLLAFIGILFLSPDTLLVRLLQFPQWTMQFHRGLGMCLFLSLSLLVLNRGKTWSIFRAVGKAGVLTGLCFSISTLFFIQSLYLTSVANTLALISTAPIFTALLSRLLLREQLPLRTWMASVGSFLAVLIIVSGNASFSSQSFLGDMLALCQAVFSAMAFVLVRSRPEVNMVPCMALSGLFSACIALPFAWGALAFPLVKLPLLLMLVAVVLPLSFGLLLIAPRYVSAPEVSMIMLLEMILGPFYVWLVTGECVPVTTIAGGLLLFTILLGHSWLSLHEMRRFRLAVGRK